MILLCGLAIICTFILYQIMNSDLSFIVDKNPIAQLAKKIIASGWFDKIGLFLEDKLFTKAPDNIRKALFTWGILSLTYWSLKTLYKFYANWNWVPKHLIYRRNVNQIYFKNRYGDCYVLITGCTDGIGLSFAEQFVKMGFNLVMVARNEQKLNNVINGLNLINPKCQFIRIIGDLSKKEDIQKIANQLNKLTVDIGIVINNAGLTSTIGSFFSQDPQYFQALTNVNFHSVLQICRVLIPKLTKRPRKSGLINVSSCTGYFNSHMLGVYPATKFALDIFTRTLSIENKDIIDVISSRPFGVTTKMMHYNKGPYMITAQDCAISTLADLGKFDTTFTGFKHKLMSMLFSSKQQQQNRKFFELSWKKLLKKKTIDKKL